VRVVGRRRVVGHRQTRATVGDGRRVFGRGPAGRSLVRRRIVGGGRGLDGGRVVAGRVLDLGRVIIAGAEPV
jgi:hypothetical protein